MPKTVSAYEGGEPYVFISYAHKDTDKVLPVIRGLHQKGVRVWYDGGLELTEEWLDCIAEHLDKCCCVISFVSRNFESSHNCRQEISFAIEEGKGIAVVYLEPRENLKARTRMQLGPLHAMFYERYATVDAFVAELVKASVLRPCMGEPREETPSGPVAFDTIEFAGEEKTVSEETPEDWYKQAEGLYAEEAFTEAVALYYRAAQMGYAPAQNALGYCYDIGKGITQDAAEAVKWFRAAAEQGLAKAQCNMGWC